MSPEEIAADRMTCRSKYVTNPNGFEHGEAVDAAIEFADAARARWPAAVQYIEELRGRIDSWVESCQVLSDKNGELSREIERLRQQIDVCPTCRGDKDREIERLQKENAALREQINGHAERIAKQSELLSRRTEK